jgi:hypothetical protein
MSRRHSERDVRDARDLLERSARESRGMQQEQHSRERESLERTSRQTADWGSARLGYSRDSDARLERQSDRHFASRPILPYVTQDTRDDLPSKREIDDPQERSRGPINLEPERKQALNHQEYFLPGEGINREVIQNDITRYLGNDATVRPYAHPDGRQGYLIRACRPPTTVSDAQMVGRWQRIFHVITVVTGDDRNTQTRLTSVRD